MWKGTAATLKLKPTSRSPMPTNSIGLLSIAVWEKSSAIFFRLVVPAAP